MFVHYADRGSDGNYYCIRGVLNPFLMTSDYLLFDTLEECVSYWENEGIHVIAYGHE